MSPSDAQDVCQILTGYPPSLSLVDTILSVGDRKLIVIVRDLQYLEGLMTTVVAEVIRR